MGALREATGVGMWFREEFTAFDAPRMTVTPSGDCARVDWVTAYTNPALAGGKAMEAISSRLLRSGFTEILDGCAKALER